MGVTDNISVLPATPTDRERAADYRERMIPLLNSVAAIMNDAAREGMEIQFQMQRDQYGRWIPPQAIGVVRVL